jgi:DNA-binding CsgD family transcriptional regulator
MINKNIAIIEPSELINEIIYIKLKETKIFQNVYYFYSIDALYNSNSKYNVLIINPICILNREKEFNKYCQNNNFDFIIALIYQIFTEEQLKIFNDRYYITEPISTLINKIKKEYQQTIKQKPNENLLTDREKEILKLLAKGLSIKEIANNLNLSPHTVLTHRKNISFKTGIKTIAGLTILALSLKLVTIEEIEP